MLEETTGILGILWAQSLKFVLQNEEGDTVYTISTVERFGGPEIVLEACDDHGPCATYVLSFEELYEAVRDYGRKVGVGVPPPTPTAKVSQGRWVDKGEVLP